MRRRAPSILSLPGTLKSCRADTTKSRCGLVLRRNIFEGESLPSANIADAYTLVKKNHRIGARSTSFYHQVRTIDVRADGEHFKLNILRRKHMDGECGAGKKKAKKRR